MKYLVAVQLFVVAPLLFAGCSADRRSASPEPQPDVVLGFDDAADRVFRSESYSNAVTQGVQDLRVRDEGSDASYFELGIFEDRGTHYCRVATMRVSRCCGVVEHQTYDAQGEFLWIPETLSDHIASP